MRHCLLLLAVWMTLCTTSTLARVLTQQQPNSAGVGPLLQNVFAFWLQHGPDKQYGKQVGMSWVC